MSNSINLRFLFLLFVSISCSNEMTSIRNVEVVANSLYWEGNPKYAFEYVDTKNNITWKRFGNDVTTYENAKQSCSGDWSLPTLSDFRLLRTTDLSNRGCNWPNGLDRPEYDGDADPWAPQHNYCTRFWIKNTRPNENLWIPVKYNFENDQVDDREAEYPDPAMPDQQSGVICLSKEYNIKNIESDGYIDYYQKRHNLLWKKPIDPYQDLTWLEAQNLCSNGWTLPTISQIQKLHDDKGTNIICPWSRNLNNPYRIKTVCDKFWTKSLSMDQKYRAQYKFKVKQIFYDDKNNKYTTAKVICLKDASQVEWTDQLAEDQNLKFTFEKAQAFCDNFGKKTDPEDSTRTIPTHRLPTIAELQSIERKGYNEYKCIQDGTGHFENCCYWKGNLDGNCQLAYWSSTKAGPEIYYTFRFRLLDYMSKIYKADINYEGFLRCVKND